MTATGTVNRWALLRQGPASATVTRVTPDTPDASPAFVVELREQGARSLAPDTYHVVPTWREALRLAAELLTTAIARSNVRAWED